MHSVTERPTDVVVAKPHARYASELLAVRQILDEADRFIARGDDIALRVGVMLSDLAAESLLRVALKALGGSVRRDSQFDSLLDAVVEGGKLRGKMLDYTRNSLRPLRNLRNTVQHDGIGPRRQDAQRLHWAEKAALDDLCSDVFGIRLGRLRAVAFVKDATIAKLLDEAEAYFEAGNLSLAACWCEGIFRTLMSEWARFNQQLFGFRERHDELVAQIIGTLSSGIYLPDLARFKAATHLAGATVSPLGEVTSTDYGWGNGKTPDEQYSDAEFALDFVSALALQLETHLST